MNLTARRLFAAAPVLLFPFSSVSVATPPVDGWAVQMKVETKDGSMTIGYKFGGDKVRIEPSDMGAMTGRGGAGGGAAAAMMQGAYMLSGADGKTTVVLTSANMAMTIDMAAMMSNATGTTPPDAKVEDLGAGESIAGHATHRYKITSAAHPDQVTTVWLTTDLAGLDFKKLAASAGGILGGAAAIAGKFPAGFPMRMQTMEQGAQSVSMEVTSAEKSNFDPSVFEVPAGIQVMDAAGMMGGRGGRGRGRGSN